MFQTQKTNSSKLGSSSKHVCPQKQTNAPRPEFCPARRPEQRGYIIISISMTALLRPILKAFCMNERCMWLSNVCVKICARGPKKRLYHNYNIHDCPPTTNARNCLYECALSNVCFQIRAMSYDENSQNESMYKVKFQTKHKHHVVWCAQTRVLKQIWNIGLHNIQPPRPRSSCWRTS